MMIQKIAQILKTENSFIVVTHISPDGDAIGSLLATYLALSNMGKNALPLLKDKIPHLYDFLPSQDKVIATLDELSFTPKWIIALDCAEEKRICGDIAKVRKHAGLINIDHHPTNPHYGDLNLVNSSATSTSEIVYQILKATGHPISVNVAKCLYTGLVTDTGGFRFAGVNSNTFQIAAELLDTGFDSYEVCKSLFEEYPLGRLQLEKLMLERLEQLLDGRLVISTLYSTDFEKLGLDRSDAEDLVNMLKQVRGTEVGVLITEMENGVTRVSLRSKNQIDVSAIAQTLGGGGHRRAAGIRTQLSPQEVKSHIERAVSLHLSNN